jgi:hypothetical protein
MLMRLRICYINFNTFIFLPQKMQNSKTKAGKSFQIMDFI